MTLAIFCWVGLVVASTIAENNHKNIEKSGTILIFWSPTIYFFLDLISFFKSDYKKTWIYYIHNVWKIKMVPDFSVFLWFFSAIVLATRRPIQQKIAKLINYHSSQSKIPVSYLNPVKSALFWTNELRDWFWPSFRSNFLKLLVPIDSLGPVLWK